MEEKRIRKVKFFFFHEMSKKKKEKGEIGGLHVIRKNDKEKERKILGAM